MRTTRMVLLIAGLIAASLAGPLTGVAAADDGGRPLSAEMTGAAEAPGPGDPDGSGFATFQVNPGQEEICYTLTASNLDTVTAAHIHVAPVGVPGPVVVPLVPPVSGTSSACASGGCDPGPAARLSPRTGCAAGCVHLLGAREGMGLWRSW